MSRIKDYLMDIEEGRIVHGELQDKCVCSGKRNLRMLTPQLAIIIVCRMFVPELAVVR